MINIAEVISGVEIPEELVKNEMTKGKWVRTTFYSGRRVTVLKENIGYEEARKYARNAYLDRMKWENLYL